VHSAYETAMVNSRRREIIDGLGVALTAPDPRPLLRGHRAVAVAVVELMQRVVALLPPEEICDVYARSHAVANLWDALGERTIECIADGCRTLAAIWSSAWAEAGAAVPQGTADRDRLRELYSDAAFAPSLYLAELDTALTW